MARKIQAKSRTPEPKPGQSSEDYWREREARQRAANIHDEARYAARINSIFQTTQDNIQQEIESFYARYAAKEGIDIAEARKRVSQIDMEKYERLAEQYVKAAHEGGREAAFSDEANAQMRLYNATMRINRLEMLKARCGIRAMEGYRLTEQLINDKLEERVYSEYARLAGILGNTVQFNENMVRSIVNASYQNATWSQRLWRNQALLSEQIGAQLVQGILTGKSSMVLARNIQKLTGGSAYACQRLMRTELRRVQTAAAEQSMRDNGVKEYKFMVENAVNPCDECLDLDGEIFRLDDMAVGKNAPPIHPNCHCSTAPYVDEEKWQRWLDGPAQEGVPWDEFEEDRGTMSRREDIGNWPPPGERINKEQLQELIDYGSRYKIDVKSFDNYDGDIELIKSFIDGIVEVANDYPEILNGKRQLQLRCSYQMAAKDYAETTNNCIQINGNAYRDREALRLDYEEQQEGERPFFVKGTTYKNIPHHEAGHLIVQVFGLSAKKITRGIDTSTISEYATSRPGEAVAESFSTHYAGVENSSASQIKRNCDIIIAERRAQ